MVDLVVCHGDCLNADHGYIHKNKSIKSFGTYGDILIRDRKMYVAPTPFALTSGTTGMMTLIIPESFDLDPRFQEVGKLARVEARSLVIGYTFDLQTNDLRAEMAPNPRAGTEHRFIACRLATQAAKPVSMVTPIPAPADAGEGDEG
jgi:hypothetical protein